jgi:hypothetical protein
MVPIGPCETSPAPGPLQKPQHDSCGLPERASGLARGRSHLHETGGSARGDVKPSSFPATLREHSMPQRHTRCKTGRTDTVGRAVDSRPTGRSAQKLRADARSHEAQGLVAQPRGAAEPPGAPDTDARTHERRPESSHPANWAKLASAAPGSARITIIEPAGAVRSDARTCSRRRRLTRLRTTAGPTRRPAMTVARG